MKTLKKFLTCLESQIKKIFFKTENASFDSICSSIPDEINKQTKDDEGMKIEEYLSKYKATTRWQTV